MPNGLLHAMRVVGLAVNIPGPYVLWRLKQMGADTIKVEPPEGDALATASPAYYGVLTAGSAVMRLNLKTTEGMAAFHNILQDADLLVTTQRPDALMRLGLGWESLRQRHPRLCYIAIVGHAPPHENVPGHDLTYQARMGLIDGEHMPRILAADMVGAEQAVSAALALLLARERGASPGHMMVSLEAGAHTLAETIRCQLTSPGAPLGGGLPSYRIYPAKEGHVAVAALEAHFAERLKKALAVSVLNGETIAAALMARSATAWESLAEELDLPLAAVREWPPENTAG